MTRPSGPVCSLYVPGDRPDRFAKAAASGADMIVLDLEDAVSPSRKGFARTEIARWLESEGDATAGERPPSSVRVNAPGSEPFVEDLQLVTRLIEAGHRLEIRVPKVETSAQLGGLSQPGLSLHLLIETAQGLRAVEELAEQPNVCAIGLGEADLGGALGIGDEAGFAYCRSRLVVAAAAAGLRPPAMSAYPALHDAPGLAASCRAGRGLGLFGRSAVHPAQVPVILAAFAPTADEIADARATLAALEQSGGGASSTPDGRMVDAAMRTEAERVIARATRRAAG
jgi:citrate lyase subunit beta / citryl-CoA lyase